MLLIILGNHYVYNIPCLNIFLRMCESLNVTWVMNWAKSQLKRLKMKFFTKGTDADDPTKCGEEEIPPNNTLARNVAAQPPPPLPVITTPLRSKIVNGVLLILLWAYFSSTVAIFTVLQPCSDENYMKPYPWIECTGKYYTIFIIIAVMFLLIHVIGTPVLFLVLALKATKPLDGELEVQRISLLYAGYKSGTHWMFSVFMARRVVFCAITAFINNHFWTNMACVLLLLVFLVIHVLSDPFELEQQNIFQTYEVAVLIITITCLQSLPFNTPLFALVVLGNAMLLVMMIVYYLKLTYVTEKLSKPLSFSVKN